MQTSAVDPLVGRTLESRYRLLGRIARGGMSTVYAAVDERLDRQVAVKVMSSALSIDPAFSDRFAREARAAARLTHVNAVAVYDQGWEPTSDGHHVFLVMELVEGRTLRDLLREKHRLTPAESLSVMEPVLSALAAAHRAGLVHRDVKPENILLSDDGVVKVADFGLARAVESDQSSTRTGLMMGTVAYCAPEQFTNGFADQRSDVYACGVMLFELLTGQPPYKGDTAINVAYQHVHNRVPAPSSKIKGIPSEIDELVVLATDPDAKARPADAGALLAEIADIREQLELPITPVPPRPRPRRQHTNLMKEHAPDRVATDVIARDKPSISNHQTSVVPQAGAVGGRALLRPPADGPPPPVVIPPVRRPRRRLKITLLVVLLLTAGATAVILPLNLLVWRYSQVPEVTKDTPAVAKQKLRDAGYSNVVEFSKFDDRPPSERIRRGLVLSTDPAADERVAKGEQITIVVSAGLHVFTVPDKLIGRAPDRVRDKLTQLSDLVNVADYEPESSEDIPAGRVTRTVPAGGAHFTRDDTVTIYVSTGPPIVKVPDIPGDTTVAEATKTLKKTGFMVKVGEGVYSDNVAEGIVLSVAPNDEAPKGSTITITPSKGHAPVLIPDLSGQSVTVAYDRLAALGFKPHYVRDGLFGDNLHRITSAFVDDGNTDAQGKEAPYGSDVDVHFGV